VATRCKPSLRRVTSISSAQATCYDLTPGYHTVRVNRTLPGLGSAPVASASKVVSVFAPGSPGCPSGLGDPCEFTLPGQPCLSLRGSTVPYPNPADDLLNIQLPYPAGTPVRVELLSVLNPHLVEPVYSGELSENQQEIRQSLTHLDNGLYLIRVYTEEEMITYKLMIQH